MKLSPLDKHRFETKRAKWEKDRSVADRMLRFKANYEREGMRTSVEAIILAHQRRIPHVLLLKLSNSSFYRLPGGRLRAGYDEVQGLKRKLDRYFAPSESSYDWHVGECVAKWWRPHFENDMYPYLPPHITKPKECKKLFVVTLNDGQELLWIPQNYELVAVPFFELFDNSHKYGIVISSIPNVLSRILFTLLPDDPPSNDGTPMQQ